MKRAAGSHDHTKEATMAEMIRASTKHHTGEWKNINDLGKCVRNGYLLRITGGDTVRGDMTACDVEMDHEGRPIFQISPITKIERRSDG